MTQVYLYKSSLCTYCVRGILELATLLSKRQLKWESNFVFTCMPQPMLLLSYYALTREGMSGVYMVKGVVCRRVKLWLWRSCLALFIARRVFSSGPRVSGRKPFFKAISFSLDTIIYWVNFKNTFQLRQLSKSSPSCNFVNPCLMLAIVFWLLLIPTRCLQSFERKRS